MYNIILASYNRIKTGLDICMYCEMITISVVNIHYHRVKIFFLVVRTF